MSWRLIDSAVGGEDWWGRIGSLESAEVSECWEAEPGMLWAGTSDCWFREGVPCSLPSIGSLSLSKVTVSSHLDGVAWFSGFWPYRCGA